MKTWHKTLLAFLAIWLVAGGAIFLTRQLKPTAANVRLFLEQNPLPQAPKERQEIIAQVAAKLNRLEFEERRELRRSISMERFYQDLTEAERSQFLDATLPEGFRQMMLAFNKMEPERRKKFVDRAMTQLEENPSETDDRLPPEERQKIINQGLSAFYEEASTEVKLEFAPLIEQIQRSLQNL